MLFPDPPRPGETIASARPGQEVREFLALRRSAGKRTLCAPGPSAEGLENIIKIACRIPDHRRVAPWRFIVFSGDARNEFNQKAVMIQQQETPGIGEAALAETAAAFTRAPVIVGVVSSPDPTHKTPVWEQELSAGAVCYNLLLAANASGWAGCWLTEWLCYSPGIAGLMGLGKTERLAGLLYFGTASCDPQERMRPDIPSKISHWRG